MSTPVAQAGFLCEHIVRDGRDVVGLLGIAHGFDVDMFPATIERAEFFAALRGDTGEGQLELSLWLGDARKSKPGAFVHERFQVEAGQIANVCYSLPGITFFSAGLYRLVLTYDGVTVAETPVEVRMG